MHASYTFLRIHRHMQNIFKPSICFHSIHLYVFNVFSSGLGLGLGYRIRVISRSQRCIQTPFSSLCRHLSHDPERDNFSNILIFGEWDKRNHSAWWVVNESCWLLLEGVAVDDLRGKRGWGWFEGRRERGQFSRVRHGSCFILVFWKLLLCMYIRSGIMGCMSER